MSTRDWAEEGRDPIQHEGVSLRTCKRACSLFSTRFMYMALILLRTILQLVLPVHQDVRQTSQILLLLPIGVLIIDSSDLPSVNSLSPTRKSPPLISSPTKLGPKTDWNDRHWYLYPVCQSSKSEETLENSQVLKRYVIPPYKSELFIGLVEGRL